jgi:hypothetical protein
MGVVPAIQPSARITRPSMQTLPSLTRCISTPLHTLHLLRPRIPLNPRTPNDQKGGVPPVITPFRTLHTRFPRNQVGQHPSYTAAQAAGAFGRRHIGDTIVVSVRASHKSSIA